MGYKKLSAYMKKVAVKTSNLTLSAYIFTKNAGPQFYLLPYAEPMDYFSLFFNDELLNNIVVETNR
jgi:hypothetical protein